MVSPARTKGCRTEGLPESTTRQGKRRREWCGRADSRGSAAARPTEELTRWRLESRSTRGRERAAGVQSGFGRRFVTAIGGNPQVDSLLRQGGLGFIFSSISLNSPRERAGQREMGNGLRSAVGGRSIGSLKVEEEEEAVSFAIGNSKRGARAPLPWSSRRRKALRLAEVSTEERIGIPGGGGGLRAKPDESCTRSVPVAISFGHGVDRNRGGRTVVGISGRWHFSDRNPDAVVESIVTGEAPRSSRILNPAMRGGGDRLGFAVRLMAVRGQWTRVRYGRCEGVSGQRPGEVQGRELGFCCFFLYILF